MGSNVRGGREEEGKNVGRKEGHKEYRKENRR